MIALYQHICKGPAGRELALCFVFLTMACFCSPRCACCPHCCVLRFWCLQLCQMACAVRMHLDHTTFDRLQACYTYFPKPYPSTAAKGTFAGRDGLGPSTTQHAAAGSSSGSSAGSGESTSAAAGGSSSRGTVRTGAILEAPPASSMPSISATGGASSVSIGSTSFGRAGGKISTTQTNVWVATTGVTTTRLQALQREREQAASSSANSNSSGSSDMGTATSVNAPDAAV